MNSEHPLNIRRVATAALLCCSAASGAALLYTKARAHRHVQTRAARVRRDLRALDTALDRYASGVRHGAPAR